MSYYDDVSLGPSPLALQQAGALWPQVEALIRADLTRELGDNPDFMLHVVRTAESGDYLCWPDRERPGVYVDAVVWEEGPVLTEGPFKGKRVSTPRSASLKT
jgi:hypothetical protein